MNIFSKTGGYVSTMLPSVCTSQKMQFHHSTSPLKNMIENQVIPAQSIGRKFDNPNVFQGKNEIKLMSDYNTYTQDDKQNYTNFDNKLMEQSESPHIPCRKRTHKNKKSNKIPDKHNSKRQIVHELMDLDLSNDLDDITMNEEIDMVDGQQSSEKLCDLIVLPEHSSPLHIIDISLDNTKNTTCFSFSISPPSVRQRQISTTESEDSFIVFDSGTDEECDFSDDACSDSSDQDDSSDDESDLDSPESVVPTKKVRFAEDKDLCEVHPMIQWSFAYQAARKGPWEIYARDRERFKKRIKMIEKQIGNCFKPEHRQKIFNSRYKEEMDE